MLDTTYKIKNKTLQPAIALNCVKDQARAKVELVTKASTNKSANTILYHLCASAATSTLMVNQNQYPPTQVIKAPKCQS